MAHPAPLNRVEASPAPAPVSWTADPIAARILADLQRNPPQSERTFVMDGRIRHDVITYVGDRVDRLRAIERRWGLDAMRASDASDRSEADALREVDPLNRGVLMPSALRMSGVVDRVIFERVGL